MIIRLLKHFFILLLMQFLIFVPAYSQTRNILGINAASNNQLMNNSLNQNSSNTNANTMINKDKYLDSLSKAQAQKVEKKEIIGLNKSEAEEKALQNKQLINNLSVIEKMFAQDLKQFGYDMFNQSSYYPTQGTIANSYKLRIGDSVVVYLWGNSLDYISMTGRESLEPIVTTNIDKQGNIFIPGAGVFKAEGKTVSEVESSIKSLMVTKFNDIDVKLTVMEPGNFNVMVMGKVKHPGVVYLNSISTFLDALNIAGGILKTGSLRDITVIDSYKKAKTHIDLYDLIINGNYKDIRLKEGDVILVKPIGGVIGVSGGVVNPAIYEFKKGETLQTIVNYAGGFLPNVSSDKINLESFDKTTNQKVVTDLSISELTKTLPKSGDLIDVKKAYEASENFISIEGNIKHPGKFRYVKGIKLSDILRSQEELLTRTFLSQAVINRYIGINKDLITIPVSLTEFFSGSIDPELYPLDKIEILTITKMPSIEVSGDVSTPGAIPYRKNMTLNDVISMISFSKNPNDLVVEVTNPEDVLVKMPSTESEDVSDEALSTNTNSDLSNLKTDTNALNTQLQGVVTKTKITQPKIIKEKRMETIFLYDLLTLNNKEKNIEILPNDRLMFRPLIDKETLKSVKVLGYVNSPGIFKIKPGMKVSDALKLAGGINERGYLKGIIFLRPTVGESQKEALALSILQTQEEIALKAGASMAYTAEGASSDTLTYIAYQKELLDIMKEKLDQKYGRIIIRTTGNDLANIPLENDYELLDGDEIIIPPYPTQVSVIGDVYNQSAIGFSPKQMAKYYIDQVGGITKTGDKRGIYVIRIDGTVIQPKKVASSIMEPGDSVIVPRKVKIPINIRGILRDITTIGANAANTVFILTKL